MRLFGRTPVYKAMGLFWFHIWNASDGMIMKYLNLSATLRNFCNRYTPWVVMSLTNIEHEIRSYSVLVALTWSPTHTSLEFPNKAFLRVNFRKIRKNVVLRPRLYSRLCPPICFSDWNLILSIKGLGTLLQTGDTCSISYDRPWLLLAPMKYGP